MVVDVERRKIVLAAGASLIPAPLRAAEPAALPVIGFLNGASYALSRQLVRAFHEGLAETGFVEGRNVALHYLSADGHYDRLPALAAELVSRRVNVIAATGTPTGLPARGKKAVEPACPAIDEGRAVHQPEHGEGARRRLPTVDPRSRRRSYPMIGKLR
jgi:putative ABC transport system substrate-binding protein